jgi:hypothetical protein
VTGAGSAQAALSRSVGFESPRIWVLAAEGEEARKADWPVTSALLPMRPMTTVFVLIVLAALALIFVLFWMLR